VTEVRRAYTVADIQPAVESEEMKTLVLLVSITGVPAIRNVLAGLAKCGVCGRALTVETSQRKNGRVSEYVCRTRRHIVAIGTIRSLANSAISSGGLGDC
jgi:hypothetical protein